MSEIKNNIINGVGATGNVDIKVYRGNKLIRSINGHNTGTIDLCRYLRDCLTGENKIAYRPGRLVPCKKEGSSQELINLFTYGIQYLPESIANKNDDGKYSAWLDMGFIIPNTLLSVNDKINGFKLCRNILDAEGKLVEYAVIDLDDIEGVGPIIIQDTKTSIRVDWRIKLSIVSSKEEEI